MTQNPASSTFCILPWIHINARASGNISPCCNTNTFFDMNDRDVSLKDAFYSNEMNQLREDMNNGKAPEICDVCWNNERAGITSVRQTSNSRFSDQVKYGKEAKLKYLDIKFDNKCNLQCRMCDPFSSDKIWKTLLEFEKTNNVPNHLSEIKITEEEYNKFQNNEKRKEYVLESLPDLEILKCTGGEPFISKDFLEVIEAAVKTGHSKHIELSITTNGTKFTKNITSLFKYFQSIDINISLDGVEETYNYIRYPYKWNMLYDRIIDFLTDMEEEDHEDFSYRFSTIISSYNYLNMCDTQKTIDNIVNMFPTLNRYNSRINSFSFDLKPINSEMHAKWLPESILEYEKDKASKMNMHFISSLSAFVDWCKKDKSKMKSMNEKKNQLRETTLAFDKQRNQTYKNLHPKFVEWIDS